MKKSFRPRTVQKMKNKLPQVRLRRAWRHYVAGAVIQPPGTLRQVLVQQGIGEIVHADNPQSAGMEEQAPAPKKRGRPRKTSTPDTDG